MSDHTHGTHEVGEIPPAQTGVIWRTFWILLAITALEFTLAYFMKAGGFRTSIFVIMTLVKAFYIVGEFMHLKHEVKSLIWAIVLPVIFVVWLLVALLNEGGSIFELR
ncbi:MULTISPECIES: cytochrome C oxidase subunit IV family protein [Spirosoma]|uniref:Cytochrome C oxidase subunit IV family protein n=1 Tax=Spirosoma liriopis TaxID=2937440 RepID=A0ABT0HKJ7_9BACT|nr:MULTISPECIES: cytochrome C oxidase subunit IV family protein [Spirosoma]MCK8492125.1 cytochrome C oxidase subunit IV family protein [Spirosoma liriopis]UHG91546.1 cytochrome C oxidase subunit IV family protein [Spirosoma oryzicola]